MRWTSALHPSLCLLVAINGCSLSAGGGRVASPDPTLSDRIKIIDRLEAVPPRESEYIKAIVSYRKVVLKARYSPNRLASRGVHAKHHGCVRAIFEARDDVPMMLAHGVFTPGSRYDTWVRFSNAREASDTKGDGRGIALKLMGVPGAKLLDEFPFDDREKHTQDFLMINNPTFFIPDVETYDAFVRAESGSDLRLIAFFLRRPRLAFIVRKAQGNPASSPLELLYHSMTPYLLGSPKGGVAVKYWLEPIHCTSGERIEQAERSADYLRKEMSERLADVCFEFSVLVRNERPKDPSTTRCNDLPVEDPTCEWDLARTTKTSVARIMIPPQKFESEKQQSFCENLSFTPWHALPVHQPIGGLNRLRLSVYTALSKLRHDHNETPAREPTGFAR